LPGGGKEVDLSNVQYAAWEPTDEQFVKVYQEDVTGLSLPKKAGNLIQMPIGRKQ